MRLCCKLLLLALPLLLALTQVSSSTPHTHFHLLDFSVLQYASDISRVACRHLLGVILPLLVALSRARDVRPVLHATFDMAGWFGRRGVCMYERPDRTLTAAAMLAH